MRQRTAVAAAFLLAAGFARAGQKAPPRARTEGNGVWSSHVFVYDGAGNITAIGDDAYVYDSAGRLVRGTANGPNNRQDYAYDSFGNRLRADTIGAPCAGTVTCGGIADVDWRTNRLRDHNAGYDDAGNLTRYDPKFDPANPSQSHPFSYAYDGAGMVSNITAPDNVRYEYVYTVDDERLAINTNGGNWRFTVRDLAGRVIREVNAYVGSNGTTWLWDRDHVFRDTALLATISATGTQQFHLDHLGTPRVVTDATGGQLGMHTYYPYGEELNLGPQENPEERLKFTGHERDAVGSGGLDYMHARYYAASSGRFLSVDAGRDQHPAQPQSWNLYAYALDNPMLRIDPTGRNAVIACSHNNCVVNTFVQIVRDPGDPAAVAAANGFKQNAESYWNRQHLTGPNGEQVTFNVVTTIVNPGQADHAQDTMTVVHGSGQAVVTQETEPAGKMGNPPDHGLLFTTEGTANPSGHSGVDPHEMGHFFGLGDKGPRPLPNWGSGGPTDDIMEYAQPGNSPLTAAADLFNPANRDVAILMLDLLRDMQ